MTRKFQVLFASFLFLSLGAGGQQASDAAPKLKSLKVRMTTEEHATKRSVDVEIEATDDVGLSSVKLIAVGRGSEEISVAEGKVKGKGVKKAKFNLSVDVSDPATSSVRIVIEDTAGNTTVLSSPQDFKVALDPR